MAKWVTVRDLKPKVVARIAARVEDLRATGKTWRAISKELYIPKTTLMNWDIKDMRVAAIMGRLRGRGSTGKITEQEITALLDAAANERKLHRPVSVSWTQKTVADLRPDHWIPSAGWCSKF